jgi:hypothetical protein
MNVRRRGTRMDLAEAIIIVGEGMSRNIMPH